MGFLLRVYVSEPGLPSVPATVPREAFLAAKPSYEYARGSMTPKELEQTTRSLLKESLADAQLRERFEKLAADEISFSGFTWLFGPELYRRNRILFRPFILSRFSTYMTLPKWKVQRIRWKGEKAVILEGWLAEVDKDDDADLFRRLYEWKLSERFDWRKRKERAKQIFLELLPRF